MTCRESRTQNVTIPSGTDLSGVLSFYDYAYGIVHMPAAWTAANIGFQVASELDGTFQPLYDASGVLVEISSPDADQAHAIPVEVLAARFVKLWSQTAGSGVNQAAERALSMDMKS